MSIQNIKHFWADIMYIGHTVLIRILASTILLVKKLKRTLLF